MFLPGSCRPGGKWGHEGSRGCVLQQGLGSVVAAGGGDNHSPCTEHWAGLSVPTGMRFPEELKHLMFLELGLRAVLGVLPYWQGIESLQGDGQPGPEITRQRVIRPPPL